ncbi:leucyl aminopeptidase [Sphingobium sp. B2D3A]|uniref:leucyl aminopeptidase n=1 Tax=unclassified Sphingobium TaxID=2611147 RepID=UPI002224E1B4|nr:MULTISPECIES: leucyl aminopeptidase [unclassified Sphingobium]MCW2338298.1 leucyl aminopeptidase [Sphingobium sp. B2D3A]MCW2384756.1 leucyl aminopeptidase [Sphingobium sp. B2D3D]
MHIAISASRPADMDCLVFPVAKGAAVSPGIEAQALAAQAAEASRFGGEAGAVVELFVAEAGKTLRVLLVGTGEGKPADLEKAGGAVTARLQTSGVKHVAIDGAGLTADALARIALGVELRAWRIDTYRTKLAEKAKPTLETVTLVHESGDLAALVDDAKAVAQGVAFTRELVAEPGNIIYPESFVERCRHLVDLGIEISVLDETDMANLGMGALLGVAQGSVRKPRILSMRWDGTNGAQAKPLALVGKGVTFDTGGISLKPGAGMEDMKWDMGGAGAVAGAMKALALRKAPTHVVGICGLVENMPDGGAQRPGDIVKTMSGQTVEVLNTDAEGRLVLCDAIWWTQQTYKPETVIDLATLTGAMLISLGSEHGGLFSNDDDLAEQLLAAGRESGDKLWRFPLSPAYDKLIDSPIADMKNIGPRYAGSITAAQFIKRYVQDGVKWAHLDIAGMVWADKPGATWEKGATGYGVRLLDQLIRDHYQAG